MDFGKLLHTASKNEQSTKKEIKYYSTKFEPPKKLPKDKSMSVNVKNFLARKEAEERQKAEETKKKRNELLALRSQDKKATRRVNVMLKRTKSANQSVIDDAVDKDNTAVTLAGPSQPDEDDYGYVSQEAANFYNKMMEKYSKMPDEPKFNFQKKRVSVNLNGTKDRVRAALDKEKEDAMLPHRRKRKRKEEGENEECEEAAPVARAKPKPAAPPPLNFAELLKIAEKKQFEPIVIEPKVNKDDERPLTKKQKKEMEREKEWRDRREGKLPPLTPSTTNKPQKPSISPQKPTPPDANKPKTQKNDLKTPLKPTNTLDKQKLASKPTPTTPQKNQQTPQKVPSRNVPEKSPRLPEKSPKTDLKPAAKPSRPLSAPMDRLKQQRTDPNGSRAPIKPKQFPPADVRRKEGPSGDVRRGGPRRKPLVVKGRILDDDDEYDSEMDDFIDDGPEEDGDYSKYISEIFGYDKSKYRNLEDDVDNMESSFAQQMKEEFVSTKIGIMEDLEDMKKEEEEKRKKALLKKKQKL